MKNSIRRILSILILAAVMLPNFAIADSASFNVKQSVCDEVTPCAKNGGGVPPDTSAPFIFDVAAKATYHDAIISWSTNELSLGKVSWGKTRDYRDGEISVELYAEKQTAQIQRLESQTQYFFRIIAFDQSGNERVYEGKFLTLIEPDVTGPQNVSHFVVTPNRDRMTLAWANPPDADFDSVRVVRSEIFYPLDPFNGAVVYEGREQFASDGAVTPGHTYYYAIFAKDKSGNYSTGSLGAGMIIWYSEAIPQYPDAPVVDIKFPQAPGTIKNPASFNDFQIIYNNGATQTSGDNAKIPSTDVQIVVPQDKLPEGTNSLTLTVKDNKAGEYTYLFAFNKLTKEFFANVPALVVKESYRLVITLFDSAQRILQTVAGSLQIVRSGAEGIIIKSSAQTFPWWILFVLLALLAGWAMYEKEYFSWNRQLPPPEPKKRGRKKTKISE